MITSRFALAALTMLAGCGAAPAVPVADTLPTTDAASDAPTTTRDPAGDGGHAISETTIDIPGAAANRTLPSTVFAPTTAGPHPLVVISPGFQMERTQYVSYGRHLATWGFVAVVTDYAERGLFPPPNHTALATDVPAVVSWALGQSALAVDPARIALAGHSLGGRISVLAAAQDPRVRAVVGWDPVDATNPSAAPEQVAKLTAAVAVIGETTNASGGFMPCAPAAENFTQFYAAAPSPALQATVAGADHMDWVDDPSCSLCNLCTAGTADPELVRTATRRLTVAWLVRQLINDVTMESWLTPTTDVAIERR